jgi:hypothetical protein
MEPVFLLAAVALALILAGVLLKLRPAPKPVNSIYAAAKAGKLGAAGAGKAVSVVANAAAEKDARPSVRLLYGTQTGTAERFAKQLGAELRARYGGETKVRVEVTDAEHYFASGSALDERLEAENVLLLLFATYGDGEPTDNAADLYSWITTEVDEVEGGAKNAYLHVSFLSFCASDDDDEKTRSERNEGALTKRNTHTHDSNQNHNPKPTTERALWRVWPRQQAVRALQRRRQAPARRARDAGRQRARRARRRRRRRLHRRRL